MKRYDATTRTRRGETEFDMKETPTGQYVEYREVKELETETARLRQSVAHLEEETLRLYKWIALQPSAKGFVNEPSHKE